MTRPRGIGRVAKAAAKAAAGAALGTAADSAAAAASGAPASPEGTPPAAPSATPVPEPRLTSPLADAAVRAAATLAEGLVVTILARAARWRGGLPWAAGQRRTLPLADLSAAQLTAFEADPDFAVIPEQGSPTDQ